MAIEIRDEEGGVRILTLARPPANAVNLGLMKELEEAVRSAADDSHVRAVILRGNERFFSAGLDLNELAAGDAGRMATLGSNDAISMLWTLPKPTIAEVQGHAIAAGAILALACDIRLAARGEQKIGLNETKLGLPLPRGAFEIARCALPSRHLGRLLLGAGLYGPQEACELGYVHELLEAGELATRSIDIARRLGSHPPRAYAYNKMLIQEPYVTRSRQATPDAELIGIWTSDEVRETISKRTQGGGKKE